LGAEKSKPACGGGASGESLAEPPGTVRIVEHLGHLAFFPAALSGTRNCCWQLGHKNSIGMATFRGLLTVRNHHTARVNGIRHFRPAIPERDVTFPADSRP
jgi:hypothetical protein